MGMQCRSENLIIHTEKIRGGTAFLFTAIESTMSIDFRKVTFLLVLARLLKKYLQFSATEIGP
jgi:hypothetical protein